MLKTFISEETLIFFQKNASLPWGGGALFFIDLVFFTFLLSAVQKSPPPFSFSENRSFVRSFGDDALLFLRSVVSTLTCRFTFIYRFFGPLKGLPLNTFENYGMAS